MRHDTNWQKIFAHGDAVTRSCILVSIRRSNQIIEETARVLHDSRTILRESRKVVERSRQVTARSKPAVPSLSIENRPAVVSHIRLR